MRILETLWYSSNKICTPYMSSHALCWAVLHGTLTLRDAWVDRRSATRASLGELQCTCFFPEVHAAQYSIGSTTAHAQSVETTFAVVRVGQQLVHACRIRSKDDSAFLERKRRNRHRFRQPQHDQRECPEMKKYCGADNATSGNAEW